MAKKSTNANASEPGNSTASKTATKPKKARTPKTSKAAEKKSVTSGLRPEPVTKPAAASVTEADVALRAYYIAEKRQKLGIPGDSTSDWVEAERQLKAEAAAKKS